MQTNPSPKLSRTFFLSAGEVNAEARMALPLLTAKIIDIATEHANSLGIGNPDMRHLGYGWVLSRIVIEINSYPRVNEEYTLSTWIESWNRHFSVRNFMIADADGKPCGYASSVWMVLNSKTRENAGTSHLNLDQSLILGETVPIARMSKHRPIVEPGEEIHNGALVANAPSKIYTFGYSDLDFYRHVNTVRYVSMLLNCFTLEEMDTTEIERLEMSFLRESRYGETVKLMQNRSDLQTSFALSDAADGTDLFFAFVKRRATAFS